MYLPVSSDRIVSLRECVTLTDFDSPGNMLRTFPHLKAKDIITGTVNCVRKIPNDLYEELVHHME